MALSDVQLGQILGFQCQGDIGPLTTYTQFKAGKKSIVIFWKQWLSDPTTLRQLNHRNRVRNAAAEWQQIPKWLRKDWQRAANKANLRINGYALWVYWQMIRNRSAIRTVELQTGITLIYDDGIPAPTQSHIHI